MNTRALWVIEDDVKTGTGEKPEWHTTREVYFTRTEARDALLDENQYGPGYRVKKYVPAE